MSRNDGVQSLDKGLLLLRIVAEAGGNGLRLTDIVSQTEIHKATVARLLSTLTRSGALTRGEDRRFRIDPGFRALYGAPTNSASLREAARPAISRLVEVLGDVSFLSVRSGFESLCIERHVGSFAIQALSLNVGSRRPLGIGAGSMALLAHLDEDEREDVLQRLPGQLAPYPHITLDAVRHGIATTRAGGFSDLPNFVIPGMTGMGIAVRDREGVVIGALSVAAVGDRLANARRDIAIEVLHEARAITEDGLRATYATLRPPDRRQAS